LQLPPLLPGWTKLEHETPKGMRYKHENEDGTTELQRARPTQELKELRKLKKADYKTDAGFKDLEEFLCKEALNTKPIYDIKLDYVKRMNEEAKTNAEIMKSAKTSLMRETRAQELGFKSAEERAERHETWLQWKKLDIATRRAERLKKAKETANSQTTTGTAESVPSPAVVEPKQAKPQTPEPATVAIPRSDFDQIVIEARAELKRKKEQLESLRENNANPADIKKARREFSLARFNVQLVKAGKQAMTQEQRDAARNARAEAAKTSTSTSEKPAQVAGMTKQYAWRRRRLAEDDDCSTFREALRAVRGY